ncbi:MAG: response regulator [Patescibacteria group bacterium]
MNDAPKTVLIVEDEPPLANIIKIRFEQSGFGVYTARTATEALDILKKVSNIDVIWLDHYLVGSTGLELVEQVKQDPAFASIPIYLVTNTAGDEAIYNYLHLGVVKYFVKTNIKLTDAINQIVNQLNFPETVNS